MTRVSQFAASLALATGIYTIPATAASDRPPDAVLTAPRAEEPGFDLFARRATPGAFVIAREPCRVSDRDLGPSSVTPSAWLGIAQPIGKRFDWTRPFVFLRVSCD